jgi:hypothetical protein
MTWLLRDSGADIDDNKVSPENAEVEARFRFERDLIRKED